MALIKLFDCAQGQRPKVQIWNSDYLAANALMFLNSYYSVWLFDGFIESILFPAVDPAGSLKNLFWICNSKLLFLDLYRKFLLVLPCLTSSTPFNPLILKESITQLFEPFGPLDVDQFTEFYVWQCSSIK